ncbi:hypothetical protein [Streptomyces caatingaensis]|uniref:hypothetical protein n=1 Tax=Streptomyces caatingaensis TaxID=1678637 RepID=UPI000AC5AAC6|nr:hypothetical protein [Streptomyces caatingaensis]
MTAPADDALPNACTCPTPWEKLVAIVEGQPLHARPADSLGPAGALYRVHCATCGVEYPGHRTGDSPPGQRRTF